MAFFKKLFKAVGRLFSSPPSTGRKRRSAPRGSRRKRKRPTVSVPRRKISGQRRSRKRKKIQTKKKRPVKRSGRTKRAAPRRKLTVRRESQRAAVKPAQPKKKSFGKGVSARPKPPGSASAALPVREQLVGDITHYFSKIEVCVVKVKHPMAIGDRIRIKGHTTDFVQTVESMQVESKDVRLARKGQLVGLKVKDVTRTGDQVYRQG